MSDNGDDTSGGSGDEFVCSVEGCDYSAEEEGSIIGHSSAKHHNPRAWEDGLDRNAETLYEDDDEPAASSGGGGGVTFGGLGTQDSPNDVLESVLKKDPELENDQVRWVLDWRDDYQVIDTSELHKLLNDVNADQSTVSRITDRYASVCQTKLKNNPNLAERQDWALLLTKETGQQWVQYANSGRTPQQQGGYQNASITPPPGVQGNGQGQAQQQGGGGQQQQTGGGGSPSPSGAQIQPPAPQPRQPAQPQPQGNQQSSANSQQIQQLQRQQKQMMELVVDKLEGDDDGNDMGQLRERIQEVNALNQQLEQLGGSGDDDLRHEIEELRSRIAEGVAQEQSGDDGGDISDLTSMVEMAAREDTDLDVSQVSEFADAMGVTDPEVKAKEIEMQMQQQKMESRKKTIDAVFSNLSNIDAAGVGKALAKIKDEMASSGGDEPTEADLKRRMAQARQAQQPGHATAQPQQPPRQPHQPPRQPQQPPQQPQGGHGHGQPAAQPGNAHGGAGGGGGSGGGSGVTGPPKALQREQEREQEQAGAEPVEEDEPEVPEGKDPGDVGNTVSVHDMEDPGPEHEEPIGPPPSEETPGMDEPLPEPPIEEEGEE